MIADMESNKKIRPIVTGLFIRGRKLHVSIAFISQSCFKVPKTKRLNATHYFIMNNLNKRENHQRNTLICSERYDLAIRQSIMI